MRLYKGSDSGDYWREVLGAADDHAPANGVDILDYRQAVAKASEWAPGQVTKPEALTVREAAAHYLDWFEQHCKSLGQTQALVDAHILPKLGSQRVADLTAPVLRRWHEQLAKSPARVRGGGKRKLETEDHHRARRVSANNGLKTLKALLNRAVVDGLAEPSAAWSKVKPFRGVDRARHRFLETEDLRRLLNSAPKAFRNVVEAAVHTGARYGELCALEVRDFSHDSRAILFAKTKSSAPRHVHLSDEGMAFFEELTAGRKGTARMLLRADGEPWGKNHQSRPMREACEAVGIDPPIVFHELRHTYASLYLMSGGSLVSLAKQLGHTTTRMVEKHYGHLADQWRQEEAAKHAPKLGRRKGRLSRLRARR